MRERAGGCERGSAALDDPRHGHAKKLVRQPWCSSPLHAPVYPTFTPSYLFKINRVFILGSLNALRGGGFLCFFLAPATTRRERGGDGVRQASSLSGAGAARGGGVKRWHAIKSIAAEGLKNKRTLSSRHRGLLQRSAAGREPPETHPRGDAGPLREPAQAAERLNRAEHLRVDDIWSQQQRALSADGR